VLAGQPNASQQGIRRAPHAGLHHGQGLEHRTCKERQETEGTGPVKPGEEKAEGALTATLNFLKEITTEMETVSSNRNTE